MTAKATYEASAPASLKRLLALMALLRDKDQGCPWDVEQSFETIAPYTIEEAYEVADAIDRKDMPALRDELGDLLFQVLFHARMAQEAGAFDFADVATGLCDKMERRHPHVFGEGEKPDWEALKAQERNTSGGALDGVALGYPALMRAEKLQKRASRVGFDWPDPSGARAKISEEIAEVESATSHETREEEIGDLLFSVVNWARHLGVDPETALRVANKKFETRFRAMEADTPSMSDMDIDQLEALWSRAKRA